MFDLEKKQKVFVEIEQDSNIKYEYDENKKELIIDRVLSDPFVYPYAYGFIPNTLASDGDPIDALIITNEFIEKNREYDVYIIGSLEMEDEHGMDEKLLCVLEKDYSKINDIDHISSQNLQSIWDFFENYKKNENGKWTKLYCFLNKAQTIDKLQNPYP